MDTSLAPKLLAAAVLGATAAPALRTLAPIKDSVLIKLEWIETGRTKSNQTLVLRAPIDVPSTVIQGDRTVQAQPAIGDDGTYHIALQITDAKGLNGRPDNLTTRVHSASGETVVVMGNSTKSGRDTNERLLFMTVTPIE